MKELAFYIKKANETIERISEYQENRYSDHVTYSIDELVLETELLLFGFSENYPALVDIKLMKELYSGREFNFSEVITKKMISILTTFKTFIADHR